MKLIKFSHTYDFGHEYYLSLFSYKNWSLIQLSFDYSDFSGMPYLQITSGMGKFFGILVNVWRLGICLEVLAIGWKTCYYQLEPQEKFTDGN